MMQIKSYNESLHERVDRYRREADAANAPYYKWHRVFAWLPVPVGKDKRVWLEWVERRYTWGSSVNPGVVYDPEYRLPQHEGQG